jgi:hypothetical protein
VSHIALYSFGCDAIIVVLRFAVLRDPYRLLIAEHASVLRGFL